MDFITGKNTIAYFLIIMSFLACNDQKETFLGVVTSATPEASQAGEKIMKMGGNAVDAAVAVSFALGVTEPAMSGLGGGTQVLLSLKNQPPIAINGTTFSPQNTMVTSEDTLTYHRRSTIPSTVKVLGYLHKKYGSGNVTWKELIYPAIELAKNGFEVGEFRAKVYEKYEAKLQGNKHHTSLFLINGDVAPKKGQILKQPVLARTLERLAEYGAEDFYTGQIAQNISEDMQNNNGWISLKDLKEFQDPKELTPLSIEYGDYTIYSQPPPCGGWTTLLILRLLEEESKNDKIKTDDLVKALYLAQNDRRTDPVTDLLDYDSIVHVKLSTQYVTQLLSASQGFPNSDGISSNNSGETTHFSVIDSQENVISVTASINAYFGSLAASEQLGFLYNSYMDDFVFGEPGHPFALRPNAMAYSSMSPTIVQKNGENQVVIGSPGSSRIISTVGQLTAKWIEKQDIVDVVHNPRIHVNRNKVYFEKKKDTSLVTDNLAQEYGLRFHFPNEDLVSQEGLNPYYGGVHAIAKENGSWIGASDPRRDGQSIRVLK